jgi:hypothetical protein
LKGWVYVRDFFDVTGAATGPASKFTNVAAAAIRQFFPLFELPLVLRTRCHRTAS